MNAEQLSNDLAHFSGSENVYRHTMGYVYTDGVKYLAENAGAFWLLDLIASYRAKPKVRREPFVVWNVRVCSKGAIVTADDGNGNKLATQRIPFTDFPLAEIKLYVSDGVIMLPTEY